MNRLKKSIVFAVSFLLLLPLFADAQVTGGTIPSINLPLLGGGTFRGALAIIINTIIAITALVSVAFLIYGGFRYITSAGNDEVAEGAKKTIQNAIIGLIVVILSYTIVVVISNALIRGPSGV